jgi:hypothetical protein
MAVVAVESRSAAKQLQTCALAVLLTQFISYWVQMRKNRNIAQDQSSHHARPAGALVEGEHSRSCFTAYRSQNQKDRYAKVCLLLGNRYLVKYKLQRRLLFFVASARICLTVSSNLGSERLPRHQRWICPKAENIDGTGVKVLSTV